MVTVTTEANREKSWGDKKYYYIMSSFKDELFASICALIEGSSFPPVFLIILRISIDMSSQNFCRHAGHEVLIASYIDSGDVVVVFVFVTTSIIFNQS